jgi:hypothetical protein
LPWRGPEYPGEFPTLGYAVADLIQAKCAIPDGMHAGEPYLLTDEMLTFLLHYYRLNPNTGNFYWDRGGQLVRPQKWGKGPFSAAMICAEADAEGPVLPAGWDAKGEPVGRPWPTPWIQVTAVSEDQTANVYRALVPMIELGAISADIPDTGETRINLPSGGRIEPVTSSARSRLGQRVTFALQDETHSWLQANGGRTLADNQRRNLAGMGGRFLETTNAWDPAEESVAQQTSENNEPGVYRDDAEPGAGSIRNKQERRRMMKKVYGDSWWIDLDRIDSEIEALLGRDPAQAERFFLNRKRAAEDTAFDADEWNRLADPSVVVPDGALVVLGVDGARFEDALAVIATDVEQSHQFVVGIWERPQHAPDDYEHDAYAIDGAMTEVFERYDVWRVGVDPQWIDHLFTRWVGRWTDKVVMPYFTNQPKKMAYTLRDFRAAISGSDFTHDGDSQLAAHVRNAKRVKVAVYDEDRRQMWNIAKDRPHSPRKIDGAMAACISWEMRGEAIAAGATRRRKYRTGGLS